MKDTQLNNELYKSLCASVLKWFSKDRGYSAEMFMRIDGCCKDFVFPKAVIGDAERDATFAVGILEDNFKDHPRCWMGINLTFNTNIHAAADDEKEFQADVLRCINHFNVCNPELCCCYDRPGDRIDIHQEYYFYPGSHPSDDEIAGILDDFFFNKNIEDITELVESGGWSFPDLYIKPRKIEEPSPGKVTYAQPMANVDIPF